MDKKDKKDNKEKKDEISPEDYKMAFELRPQQYHSPPSKWHGTTAINLILSFSLCLSLSQCRDYDTTHTAEPFSTISQHTIMMLQVVASNESHLCFSRNNENNDN